MNNITRDDENTRLTAEAQRIRRERRVIFRADAEEHREDEKKNYG
jgi:hypothetical protein